MMYVYICYLMSGEEPVQSSQYRYISVITKGDSDVLLKGDSDTNKWEYKEIIFTAV